MQTEKINIEKLTKCKNIQMRSVANRVMTFLAKQLAIFITSSNSRCHYVEDLMLLWELVSLRRGSVIYLGLSQGQPAIRNIYTISTLCKPVFFDFFSIHENFSVGENMHDLFFALHRLNFSYES